MQWQEGTLAGNLYWQSWRPEADCKAAIVLAHGLAEHSGRYAALATALTDAGYALYALDHYGHGKSEGPRCHVSAFSDYVAGVEALRVVAATQNAERAIFLCGHSMGGLIAGLSALTYANNYRGVILSGPAVVAVDPPPTWQQWIVRLLSKIAPKAGVLALDASAISRDPAVVENYRQDPLVHTGKISARLAAEIFASMAQLSARASDIALPILLMHGGADTLTAPQGSSLLFDAVASTDKTLRFYEGLFHEIFNEPERETVIHEMIEWLDTHV